MRGARAFWLMITLCSASVDIFTFVSSAAVSPNKTAAVSSGNTNNMLASQAKESMPPMTNSGPPPMINSGPPPWMNPGPGPMINSGPAPGTNTGAGPPPPIRSNEMQTEYEQTTAMMDDLTTSNLPTSTMAETTTRASNYSSTVSSTPPYVDMYSNKLPKIINGTQYMPESTDEMEAIRPVKIPPNEHSDASSVSLLVKLPTKFVSQQGLQAIQASRLENFGEDSPNRFRDTESIPQLQAYPGYPAPVPSVQVAQPASMGSVPQVQQYSGYRAVVLPVEAYKVDWYSDSSKSDTPIKKPLDDFFYR